MTSIILTGGTSRRFGSDKSSAKIGNLSMLEILTSQLRGEELIIVGPSTSIAARYVSEKPAHSGPVAAIAAAIPYVSDSTVSIFATDMPFAPQVLNQLRSQFCPDAVIGLDQEGYRQPFAGLYSTSALKAALESYISPVNQSMQSLLDKLSFTTISVIDPTVLLDIDTVDQIPEAISMRTKLGL